MKIGSSSQVFTRIDKKLSFPSSRGLKKADIYDYDNINFSDWSFENDFCSIKDFEISKMPKELIYQLMEVKNEKI